MRAERNRQYRAFVRKIAPPGWKKEIDRECLGLLILMVIGIVSAPYLGIRIDWIFQTAAVLMTVLLWLTYLPAFALVLCLLGGWSVVSSLLTTQNFFGYGILIAGLTEYLQTRKLLRAFRRYEEDGTIALENNAGIILGKAKAKGTETFPARVFCPDCGYGPQKIQATVYSRFALRYSSHNADWQMCCPQCGRTKTIRSAQAKKLAKENGEFAAYKRAEIEDGWLVGMILAFVLLVASVFLAGFIAHTNRSPVFSPDVTEPTLPHARQFVGREVFLLDAFGAKATDAWSGDWNDFDQIEEIHLIAYFESDSGAYLLPVKVLHDNEYFPICIEWLANADAGPMYTNVHGYIDSFSQEARDMLDKMIDEYGQYYPPFDAVIEDAEVIYWDSETEPRTDEDTAVFNAIAGAAGLLSIFFFAMDKYWNSEWRSRRVQERYDRRHAVSRLGS